MSPFNLIKTVSNNNQFAAVSSPKYLWSFKCVFTDTDIYYEAVGLYALVLSKPSSFTT